MEKTQAKKKEEKTVEKKDIAKKDVAKKEPAFKGLRKEPAKTGVPRPEGRNIVGNIKKFLKGSWAELKKVQWPNRPQLITFTGVVLLSVAIVSFGMWIVDSILSKLLTLLIK